MGLFAPFRVPAGVVLALALFLVLLSTRVGPSVAATPAPAADRARLAELVDESLYDEAILLAHDLIESARSEHGADSLEEAEILDHLVEALYRSGRAMEDESLDLAARALALKESHLGPDDPRVARTLLHSGNLHIYRAENEEARADYQRALEIFEAADARSTPEYGIAINNLGVTWKRSGDYSKALEIYRHALALSEEIMGPEHPDVASTLNNVANVLVNLGDYAGAIDCNRRALSIRESHYGPNNEWVGESLNNLATVLAYSGEYDESLAAQERTVEIFAETLGIDHHRYWTARMNVAVLFQDMGDYDGAREIYSQVLQNMERIFGEDHADLIEPLDSSAGCLAELGELAEAEDRYRRSLAISERHYGAGNPWTSYTLQGLAKCLIRAGRYDDALEYSSRALAVQEAAVGPESPEVCDFLNDLAELEFHQGDFEGARALADRSAEIAEISLNADHPLLAKTLLLSATAAHALGEDATALSQALRAETISRQHLRATMGVLSEHLALDYGGSRVTGLDLALSILSDGESSPRVAEVWDQVIRSRALVLDEMAARGHSHAELDDEVDVALVEDLRAARSRLANLSLRGPGWEESSAYRLMMAQAREEKDTAERALAIASRRFRDEKDLQAHGLADVAATLANGDHLVAFVRHGSDAEPECYAAFVLDSPQSQPRFLNLGPAAELDGLVTAWHEQAAYGSRAEEPGEHARGFIKRARSAEGQQQAYDVAAQSLRRRVWDPVRAETEGATRRFVVSDGSLHLVNLYALVEDDGAYVLENGPLILTRPTERSLCAARRPGAENPRLVVVGDPSYPSPDEDDGISNPDCPSLRDLSFEPLRGALQEAEEVRELWTRSYETEPRVLVGAAATEEAIKREAPECEVLHLATHGFLLPPQCTGGQEAVGARANPLLRSGLAFAIAERSADDADGKDDGLLTAEEVASLDLSRLDWAVLSACGTGLGEIHQRGEGVFGLSRSFQVAGARTVVMSLWAVDDEATRSWMRDLYESRFANGDDTAEAVHAASLNALRRLRESGRGQHPYYWAGFVALGNGQ